MIVSSWQLVADHVRSQVKESNPFATEADVTMKFIELTQKEDYHADVFAFICQKMADRSETEWIRRFKEMKKKLGWTYDDMAKFMGAKSGASVKASINRKLPAFAKLAVCVFEECSGKFLNPKPN
jgi:hypothetical protein